MYTNNNKAKINEKTKAKKDFLFHLWKGIASRSWWRLKLQSALKPMQRGSNLFTGYF